MDKFEHGFGTQVGAALLGRHKGDRKGKRSTTLLLLPPSIQEPAAS